MMSESLGLVIDSTSTTVLAIVAACLTSAIAFLVVSRSQFLLDAKPEATHKRASFQRRNRGLSRRTRRLPKQTIGVHLARQSR
jgi:hypothetical protein